MYTELQCLCSKAFVSSR